MQKANVVALRRKSTGETYVFIFLNHQVNKTLRRIGRMASDPSLKFNWYDCAVVAKKIRDLNLKGA